MKLNHQTTSPRHTRHGFSLIELLVVIVIIGILMALILPALNGARIRAKITAVATEITQLDQALVSFESKFKSLPPSSLTIPVNAASWSAADRQKILRIWDQFDFSTCGGLGSTAAGIPGAYPASPVYLNGAECLVFFLGGVNANPDPSGTPQFIGFANNSQYPWAIYPQNRDVPFFENFNLRMLDLDGDNAREFKDSLPDQESPYLYFSSQGKSYDKMNSLTAYDDFDVNGPWIDPMGVPHDGRDNPKDLSSIYLGSDGKTPLRDQGYQIISPGIDKLYGLGGVYTDGEELKGARKDEADNITNFSGGVLRP